MKCRMNDVNFIRLLLLSTELFKFEIQKYGQILCVHKPYFLMPGHIYTRTNHLAVSNHVCSYSTKHVLVCDHKQPIAKNNQLLKFMLHAIV